MKGITVLGATGSIGVSTLNVIAAHTEKFRVVALTAHRQVERLAEQCRQFQPDYAVMVDEAAADQLEKLCSKYGLATKVMSGAAALEQVASLPETDYVMAAIVGAAGLKPALAAAGSGKRVLLANKEALVMSGKLFMDEISRNGAELLPIDSEHNAIFQSMPANYRQGLEQAGVTRILLTASGGPFRTRKLEELDDVTPEQACNHPNWSMGQKISVDSATMMNKGLEVIEAHWLFNARPDQIQVMVHPQSVIHSMVEYTDGSVLAQLGQPDMRTPIAHALAWPQRMESGVEKLDLFAIGRLDFEQPDYTRFPCLRLAHESTVQGGTAPAILNAANEVAVESFLKRKIRFTDIAAVVEDALQAITADDAVSLEIILEHDHLARQRAEQFISNRTS